MKAKSTLCLIIFSLFAIVFSPTTFAQNAPPKVDEGVQKAEPLLKNKQAIQPDQAQPQSRQNSEEEDMSLGQAIAILVGGLIFVTLVGGAFYRVTHNTGNKKSPQKR